MKRKLFCLLLSMLLVTTAAQAAEKPNAAVDTSRSCTLTLQYAASGQTVRLYRAANISSNGRYTLCGAFAGYGIFMPAGNGQAEWDALRDTLLAYIAADALAPDGTAVTGADGRAVFTGLSAGMYLVDKADMEVGGSTRQYAPSLIAVPGVGGGGNWRYDVTAAPKYTEKPGGGDEPDTPVTYTVVKLWAGEKSSDKRPASVEIAICKDGVEQERQTLSADNNWMYRWTAVGGTWSVLERNVPEGYTVMQTIRLLAEKGVNTEENLLEAAKTAAFDLGVSRGIDPFMTLSFMALPVIPKLRITTRGVIDVETQQYV